MQVQTQQHRRPAEWVPIYARSEAEKLNPFDKLAHVPHEYRSQKGGVDIQDESDEFVGIRDENGQITVEVNHVGRSVRAYLFAQDLEQAGINYRVEKDLTISIAHDADVLRKTASWLESLK